jgi:hypothetical protein
MKFLYIIIVLFLATGCVNKTPDVKGEDPASVVGNAGSIAEVLGCVFAPQSCQKKSTQDQHKQADEQIIKKAEEKEWDDVDKEISESK